MKTLLSAVGCVALLSLTAAAEAAWTNRFGASFADYSVGEALSAKGTWGGAWAASAGGKTRCVEDDGRKGMAFATYETAGLRFALDCPPAADDTVKFEFSLCVEDFGLTTDIRPEAGTAAAVITVADTRDRPALAGWNGSAWVLLAADGVTLEAGKWLDGLIELKTVGADRLVRYSLKVGEALVRLAAPNGDEWMPTVPATDGKAVSSVSYFGSGRFADFTGQDRQATENTTFLWTGGAAGGWGDPANWTDEQGGEVARAPGMDGDLAVVDGTAALTNGAEAVTARDLKVLFEDGAAQRVSGAIASAVSLDVSRPQLGKPLAADCGSLLGLKPTFAFTWSRGDVWKVYGETPVGVGPSYVPAVADCGHWLRFRATDGEAVVYEKEFFFSKLPVVYIDTDDGTDIQVKANYEGAQLRIQGNADFKQQYDGAMEIKGRGNSSWGFPKKPYKLKLDKKTDLFGYGKNKHWVLLSNWLDECYLRNWLAGEIAETLGVLRMDMTWVDVVFNGEFRGNYMLGEHIRVDSKRVDVFDWSDLIDDEESGHVEEDLAWLDGKPGMDFSGGYIFELSSEYDEISKFTTGRGLQVMVNTPEYANTSEKMFGAMRKIWADFENAYASENGYGTNGLHYAEMADLASMAGYWLAQETMGNNDGSYKSRFAYKDRGAKLKFGPVWDFDWGCGSAAVGTGATGWKVSTRQTVEKDGVTYYPNFFREWLDDPLFCLRVYELYWSTLRPFLRERVLAAGKIYDEKVAYLTESAQADRRRWANETYFSAKGWTRRWFDGDATAFRTYLGQRLDWLDKQFASLDTFVKSVKMSHSACPYAKDEAKLSISFANGRTVSAPVTTTDAEVTNARDMRVAVTTTDASVVKVFAYLNGLAAGEAVVTGGACELTLDCTALDAAKGSRNILQLIARDSSGTTVARNYATLTEDDTPEAVSIAAALREDYGFAADSEAVSNVTTLAEFAKFRAFVTAGGIRTADAAQKALAYASYKLAPILSAPYLFAERPSLEIVDFGASEGTDGWRLAVELKDGADPVALAVEALRDVVSKSADLADWQPLNRADVRAEPAGGNRVKLTVAPEPGNCGFLRLEVKAR